MRGNNKKRSLTVEEFLEISTFLEGTTNITDLIEGTSLNLGVSFSLYMHYPSIGAFDFKSAGIFHSHQAHQTLLDYFSRPLKSKEDPFIAAMIESGKFMWASDAVFDERIILAGHDRNVQLIIDAVGDAICCPVYGPNNRRGVAVAAFGRPKSDFSPIMPHQMQRLFQIMHIKYCMLLKALHKQVQLTPREAEVLELICYGKTSPEIAKILEISPGTVSKYSNRIYIKLGTNDRVNAAMRAQAIDIVF